MNSINWLFESLWDAPKDKFTWESIRKKAEDMHKQEIMEAKKSIELPSDEEIEKEALSYFNEKHCNVFEYDAFIAGAKWVIDKIKNQ